MFERFAGDTREKVRRAAEIAEVEGAATVEAEHLLLALVDPSDDHVGGVLVRAGVTVDEIRAARDREFRSALDNAGVETSRPAPSGSARLRRGRTTRFGQSAKLALERTMEQAVAAGDRRITNEHLLRALVSAEVGKTPRLLDELGTSADDLIEGL